MTEAPPRVHAAEIPGCEQAGDCLAPAPQLHVQMPSRSDASPRRQYTYVKPAPLHLALITAVAVGLYVGVFGAYFLADDFHFLILARKAWSPGSVLELLRTLFMPYGNSFIRSGGYLPWIGDYGLWGLNPVGFHVTNAILHGLNSILVYMLAGQIARERGAGLLAGLLFACHPICAEAVAWLSGRFDLLSTCLYLSALVAFAHYLHRRQTICLGVSAAVGFLAFMTKEMAVTLPLAIVAFDLVLDDRRPCNAKGFMKRVWLYAPHFGALLLYALLRLKLQGSATVTVDAQPLRQPLEFEPLGLLEGGLLRLPQLFLAPLDLVEWSILTRVAVLVAAAVFAVWVLYRKRQPGSRSTLLFAGLWVLITILPVSGRLEIQANLQCSRYLYLPLVGFAMLMAFGLHPVLQKRNYSGLSLIVVAAMLAGYPLQTVRRNAVWSQAGGITLDLSQQLVAMYPTFPDDTTLLFLGIPDSLDGAHVILGDTIDSLVRLLYEDVPGLRAINVPDASDVRDLPVGFEGIDLMGVDHVLAWDANQGLVDSTRDLVRVLDERAGPGTN